MQSLPRNFAVGIALTAILTLSFTPVFASTGGTERSDNSFTVGITFKTSGIDRVCSGVLIAPTVVVTAGHCVFDTKGNIGTNYYFTAPGVALDAPINPNIKAPKILKVFSQPGFSVNTPGLPNDIAFIQLDSALAKSGFIRVATSSEITKLAENELTKGYGYGAVPELDIEYSVYPREYHIHWNKPTVFPVSTVHLNSDLAAACIGDSGGPITTVLPSGEEILLAVMSGAARVINECGTVDSQGNFTMQATIVDAFLPLVKQVLIAPTPSTAPTKKIIKINCYKGKIKKVVTGINPKCPIGYVKR